jgi:hypothetical protein
MRRPVAPASSSGILYEDLIGGCVERINLNIPKEDRARLKRLAVRAHRTEGELARELLLRALGEVEREEFARAIAAAQTPERRARDRVIARALEKLHGSAR